MNSNETCLDRLAACTDQLKLNLLGYLDSVEDVRNDPLYIAEEKLEGALEVLRAIDLCNQVSRLVRVLVNEPETFLVVHPAHEQEQQAA